jgi:hypothetical protein
MAAGAHLLWKALWPLAVAGLLAAGLWFLIHPLPGLPPALVGLLLFVLGGIVGLRAGAQSSACLMQDMLRLNKLLAEQNSALVEQNDLLLKLAQGAAEQRS